MHYCIIAAGEGSRMTQEGVSLPKPLVQIDGKPMVGRLMDLMVKCQGESISIIVNEQMTDVARFVKEYKEKAPIPVNLVIKSTPSSMHSFYELSRIITGEKFILTTVDTIFLEKDLNAYVEAFAGDDEADALMAVTRHIDDEKPLYIEVDDKMHITAFSDTRAADTRFVSGGIYGMSRKAVSTVERCIAEGQSRMRNFQRALLVDGHCVKAWDFGKILDVDHASDIEKAQQFIAENK